MRWDAYRLEFADDPDVGNLSKIKTLLYRHLEHKSNPQLIGRLYLNQSQIYQKIKNYPLAYDALEKAMKYFNDVKDSLDLSLSYYYQGILLIEEGKLLKAREKFEEALSLIFEDRDEEIQLKCQIYYQLGVCLRGLDKEDLARFYLEEGMMKARSSGFIYQETLSMQALAQMYLQMGELNKAKENYYQTLPKWRHLKEELQVGLVLDDLGYLHYKLGDEQRAISAFTYSCQIQRKYNTDKLPGTLYQLGKIYLKVDLEKSRRLCKEAIELLLEGLAYRFNLGKEKQLSQLFFLMGQYSQEKNDRKNMLLFLKESLKIYKKYRMEDHWNEVYSYFQKYCQPEEEMNFNETTELVKGLRQNGKFNLKKIVGQIS